MTRNERERLCLVVNPASAGGRTGRRLEALRRAADRCFGRWELRETEGPGHATVLAAEAVAEGFDVVASVGGDGTHSETVNGLFDGAVPRNPDVVFGAVPAGTGSDLVRTVGMPNGLEAALEVLAGGETRRSDVLEARLASGDGDPVLRLCVNVLSFGASGEVVRRANRSSKRLGGTATFLGATLSSLVSYRPGVVHLHWTDAEGDDEEWDGPLVAGVVANGEYFGGGMPIGRGSSMQDGLGDLVVVPRLSNARLIAGIPRLYTGRVDRVPGVVRRRMVSLDAEAVDGSGLLVEVDGEQPGTLPLHVRVLPGTLLIRGTWD